jgi:ketosteroid isomerase-like protein
VSDPDDVQHRLAELEQRAAAADAVGQARLLMNRYAHACDTRDPDAVAATFADDAVLEAGTARFDGRDAIAAFYRRGLDRDRRHFVTNVSIDRIDDVTVAATSYLLAIEEGADPTIVRWGHYTDRIAVDTEGARFAHRRIEMDGSAPFASAR